MLEHLLFNLLIFLIGEEETILLILGDEVFAVNEKVTIVDEQNTLTYISYSLVMGRFLEKGSSSPKGFNLYVFATAELYSLVVATDGFSAAQSVLETLLQFQIGESVQRKMNLFSAKQKKI